MTEKEKIPQKEVEGKMLNSEPEKEGDIAQTQGNDIGAREQKDVETKKPSVEGKLEPQPNEAPQKSEETITTDNVNTELLQARAQLAAFKSGVKAEVVEDALCLAMNDAKKVGAVDEATITKALKGVLARHPDWKNSADNSQGFRVGADSTQKPISSNDEISKIFGN